MDTKQTLKMPATIKILRPHQWLKNILLFIPLLTAHELGDFSKLTLVIFAFIAFSLVASSGYILNDLLDLKHDKDHPNKKSRSLASGIISIPHALILCSSCLVIGIILAAFISKLFLFTVIVYWFLSTLYSCYLKRELILDVVLLSSFYTLRIIAGGMAAHVWLSEWILLFSIFMFFSLALMKRVAELHVMKSNNKLQVSGRSYKTNDLPLLSMLGISSGLISIVVFSLYINSYNAHSLYQNTWILWMLVPIMLYWLARFWLITSRGEMHDDPVMFIFKDKYNYFLAIFSIVILILST